MLKDLVYSAALGLGFHLQRKVPDEAVRRTLARLHPVSTPVGLIRIGGEGDGGYLVPDDLEGITACFSPGVDVLANFESDMAARGIPCFLADASVDGPPLGNLQFDFEKKFIGVVEDDTFTTLDHWAARKPAAASGDLLLQMDIEGHEWPVLLNVSDALLSRFRVIVLELHGLPHLFDRMTHAMFDAALDRLGRLFHVVHSHPNNFSPPFRHAGMEIPGFLEITLLLKDRAEATGFVTRFPHPLDTPCVGNRPDYALPAVLVGKG